MESVAHTQNVASEDKEISRRICFTSIYSVSRAHILMTSLL